MRLFPQLVAAALLLGSAPSFAHDYTLGTLKIGHPWTRATPQGARTGGGYLTITNSAQTADRLVRATSPIAGRVEIHEMKVIDGVMKMRALPDGIEIAAGETIELKPGSFHIMLLDLARQIEQGAPVSLTLTFEKAGSIDVDMAVAPPGAPKPASGHDHKEGH